MVLHEVQREFDVFSLIHNCAVCQMRVMSDPRVDTANSHLFAGYSRRVAGVVGRKGCVFCRSVPAGPLPCLPTTSPALFYLRDTLRAMSDTSLPGGAVEISANDSPLGAMKRPKDGPLVTVKLPVQSALTV